MNHAYSNLLFAGTEHVPMLCFLILSEEMTKGDSENLEKSKKNENLKPYESHHFIKGLESQSKIRNRTMTPRRREISPL